MHAEDKFDEIHYDGLVRNGLPGLLLVAHR